MFDANSKIYAGAVSSPNCKTGDSTKFTKELAQWCIKNTKCRFVWGASVESILRENNKISRVLTSKGEFKADSYVLAAGAHSSIFSKTNWHKTADISHQSVFNHSAIDRYKNATHVRI